MGASVSLPDPGEFRRPLQNGHAPGLIVDDLVPSDDPGGVSCGTSCDVDDAVLDEQASILEAEFRAELDRLDREQATELRPGFESLTRGDLHRARRGEGNLVVDDPARCPEWCAYADLPVHGDGFDTGNEADIPHRGVQRDVPALHGGAGIDHAGRAAVSLQLEQDRDSDAAPVITLSVVVEGIEQYAWLTVAEACALHHRLGLLLADAVARG